jgi:pyruvate formate lyase activating enzyme
MSGMMMSEEDIVKECLKDAAYYRNGGGVTLSGGDVFFQDPHRLLKLLKEAGLHVAVENEGNVSLDRLQTYAPYIDLFLMDLKHCDADIYEKVTGGDLSRVLDNLAWIHAHCPEKLVLRIPVIPNFNEECLDEILNLASNYAKEVHLLPFHPLGKEKWRRLGRNYAYASMPLMDKSHLEAWIQKGADKGLSVSIGG